MNINMIITQILFVILLSLICVYIWSKHRSSLLTNWPVLGMTPALLKNAHRYQDFVTHFLQENNHTFQFKGPLFSNLDILFTCDPDNVNYILSKNFNNYPKGPGFRKIFDILGDGIFNADGDLWKLHRRTTMSLFNHAQFDDIFRDIIRKIVENGLFPVLDYASEQGIEVDLQDIFQRLTFDNICSLLTNNNPQSLSVGLPHIPFERAFTAAEEALFYRHFLPETLWKLQSKFGFGKEKSLSIAWKAADEFIFKAISTKHKQMLPNEQFSAVEKTKDTREEDKLNLLTAYKEEFKGMTTNPDKFLKETLLNLMVAGRDTASSALSWFFWLLAENPLVECKILEEIENTLHPRDDPKRWMFVKKGDDLRKLVYLHGAVCEALRLYPPLALNHKAPVQADILPSGHRLDKDSRILLSYYSMGRMESIWGKDCLEFKPERWINERGEIKHVSPNKFPAFNAGPRTCIGKEMAFTQIKMVATSLIYNYRIEVVQGHPIVPSDSVLLQMKYGLKVKFARRSA